MRRLIGLVPVVLTFFLVITASAQTIYGQTLFTPQVETACGYESNRFSSSDARGSSYVLLLPEAKLIWFISDSAELNLAASHLRREYLKKDASFVCETRGAIDFRKQFTKLEAEFKLNLGDFKDDAIPTEDNLWIEISSKGTLNFPHNLRVYLEASLERIDYRSLETSTGDKQEDSLLRLSPGVAFSGFSNISLWSEISLIVNDSNEGSDDYRGVGLLFGVDTTIMEEIPIGVWFEWTLRDYPNSEEYVAGGQKDKPLSIGVWSEYRFAHWIEAFSSARWTSYQSNAEGGDYSSWSVEAGIRIANDFDLPWRKIPY